MPNSEIHQAFDHAVRLHQIGRLDLAEQAYRQILAHQPRYAPAIHNLGLIALHLGQPAAAVQLIAAAIAIQPGWAGAHNNLASAFMGMKDFDRAITSFHRAIQLQPDLADAHRNLGTVFRATGRLSEAIAAYRNAIRFRPDFAEAHYELGDALTHQGDMPGAISAYQQAIALRPNYAEAYNNLGFALRARGQLTEARAAIEHALHIRPDSVQPLCNLGNVHTDLGDIDQAVGAYERARRIDPDSFDANQNLGRLLADRGEIDQAIQAMRRAIKVRPDSAEAHNNLGNILGRRGDATGAVAEYRRAIELAPADAKYGSNLLLALEYQPGVAACAITEAQAAWNQRYAQSLIKPIQPWTNDRSPDRRLRIGYVSSDLYSHASALFLLPLFENHDQGNVDVFCYAEVRRSDSITRRFQNRSAQWCNTIGRTDQEVAEQIREDAVDILVDLKLHTANNRLLVFAYRPAPVQVSWLGYPGSTGLSTIDHRLSDPHLDPVSDPHIIHLPDTFWCYDPMEGREIPVAPLPGADAGHITFGCLNIFLKVNDQVLQLWSQVLLRVENSKLVLMCPPGQHRQHVTQLFQQAGIDAGRIKFVTRQPRADYLRMYHTIDIGLDTFPYNGHTTSLDSFWMGVPVVTLVGNRPVSRAGLSQLINLGLGELAAESPEQFVRIAIDLASDLQRLKGIRAALRARMESSPLTDAARFAGNIESAYRTLWRRWCGNRTTQG